MVRPMTDTPTAITVACRYCASQNRFDADRALANLGDVRCGRCHSPLLRVHGEPLTDLKDDDLAHPWDREALAKLKAIPLLDTLIGKVLGSTLDQLGRFELMASGLRVTERQLPRLHALYIEAAGRIDVDPPPLFVVQDPMINAYTSGATAPIVAITSGAVDTLSDRSILGVLGHELTHVRLGHVLYRTVATLLAQGALKALNFLGLANMALGPIRLLLMRWMQMAELSADRGELIATGSLETHVRTAATLACGSAKMTESLDVAAFIDQAHEAESMRREELFVSLMELLAEGKRTHPLNVWRVHHALKWARSPDFFRVLAGSQQPVLTAT
jgi:Zn-dependent protease with chaperone function